MQQNSITLKIFITLFAFGIVIWLGGSIIRTAIAYEIYIPATELHLKQEYSNSERLQTVRLFAIGALYTEIAFGLAFFSGIFIFVRLRKELKTRGWIFMSFILLCLSAIPEFYMIYYDLKLNIGFLTSSLKTFDDPLIMKYFVLRFTKLNFLTPLAYLSVATSVILIIWRPLDKTIIKITGKDGHQDEQT